MEENKETKPTSSDGAPEGQPLGDKTVEQHTGVTEMEPPQKGSKTGLVIAILVIIGLALLIFNLDVIFPSTPTGAVVNEPATLPTPVEPAQPEAQPQKDVVVATVNGKDIMKSLVEKRLAAIPAQARGSVSAEILVNQTIFEELVLQEAEGVDLAPTDQELEQLIDETLQKNGISREQFNQQLKLAGTLVDEVKADMTRQIIISKMLNRSVISKLKISDAEVQDFYNKNKEGFVQPEQWRASHVLVETLEEAQEVQKKAEAGEDFAELAKQYSTGPTGPNGGDLGFFGKGAMVKEFEDAVVTLQIGEISAPVKTQFGYHVIKLTGKKEKKQLTLEESQKTIKNILLQRKQNEAIDAYLTKLRLGAEIVIFYDRLGIERNLAGEVKKPVVKEEAPVEVEQIGEDIADTMEESEDVEVMVDEATEVGDSETTACGGLPKGALIFYYADWCSNCKDAKTAVEELVAEGSNIVLVEESDNKVITDCYSDVAKPGYPQYICTADKSATQGIVTKAHIKELADSCQ